MMGFEEGILNMEMPGTWETAESPDMYEGVKEIKVDLMEGLDGFEGEAMIVTGSPFEIAGSLDSVQGDNIYRAGGDCGLVSCSNYLNICGIHADEDEIVGFALENNLCGHNPFGSPEDWGGTTDRELETILESYGVASSVYEPGEAGGTLEGIADAIEEGHAAMMGVNAGYLWDEPDYVGNGAANHQITLTGTVRDASGELEALVICDSGRHLESDSCRVVPVSTLADCYLRTPNASVIISDNAVR